ncbi:hypothetical protein [Sphingomonas sp. CFBP9021]|uniref:hypothetical protein n=1 Tax=Sphingomonas sp. CFBP9021 TaxID=3096534 RepID=UPI002A6A8A6D|nr:hypothetical protein [Sphingomonas sp. CFBP9021]MDY0967588.1 hypothetical protein [Sphingomonas sp. CFBP9021]
MDLWAMSLAAFRGSSTSNGKAVETRMIKSVKLVIRVADRAKPLRTFVFFDIGYGERYEATNPIAAPAIGKAGHFHALLQQVIEDRERSSPAVAGTTFASNLITTIIAAIGLLVAGAAFPIRADAYDLGKALAGTTETKLTSAKPLDQVERCIFLSDLAAPPIAYCSPDGRPSLIHGGRSQPIFVFELLRTPKRDGRDRLAGQEIRPSNKALSVTSTPVSSSREA